MLFWKYDYSGMDAVGISSGEILLALSEIVMCIGNGIVNIKI